MTIGLSDRILLARLYLDSNKQLFEAISRFRKERGYAMSEPCARKILDIRKILKKGQHGGRRECAGFGALNEDEIQEVLSHYKRYEGNASRASDERKTNSKLRPGRGYSYVTYLKYWKADGLELKRGHHTTNRKKLKDYAFCPLPEMLD